ncbi:hypothetical protein C0993_001048 [Termitomyces sp. T159_Od127]|nr:hypothetical protein C0993_001048 [Termitomyces sp. T159_Od127]
MPKILVANRGEIAIRVLRSAAELDWATVAIYTDKDRSHATFADEAVKFDDVDDYLDIGKIVALAQRLECTHLHPGYGFLSESPALASALPTSIVFIGPSVETLRISSDKLLSRALATSLAVKVAAGCDVSSSEDVHAFACSKGLPVIIKALDGGGGRGIRLVNSLDEIEEAFKRCLGESPSRRVFVEQALNGLSWKHVEIQIIGDGTGAVAHLWERDCSVQRRFQKIVEVAPSRLPLSVIRTIVESSMNMARHLKYRGLGTFEYLVNAQTLDWVFLEINPRVQVEHTITEEITGVDLVRTQLLLFSSSPTLDSLSLPSFPTRPNGYAMQLRLTAEDPSRSWRLSVGAVKPSDINWPSGRGVRIDTWLSNGPCSSDDLPIWTVSSDFDSLLAKVIVSGRTFVEATQRGSRALRELRIRGSICTNWDLLFGVVSHPDWFTDSIDTLWLERNLDRILEQGQSASIPVQRQPGLSNPTDLNARSTVHSTNSIFLQPGTVFHLTLSPTTEGSQPPLRHNLVLSSISENNLPARLSGVLQMSFSSTPLEFSLSQSTSAAISTSAFELANPNDEAHVASPLTGKIVELHRALQATKGNGPRGDRFVRKGEPLLILSLMKMENSVQAPYDGYVERVGKGIQTGAVLGEGVLICVLEDATNGGITTDTRTPVGATISAPGIPTDIVLLPGQYASASSPQLLHTVLTSSSASFSPSPGFNGSLKTLPLTLALEPGLAIFSDILYSGQSGFSALPANLTGNSSTLLAAKSLSLSQTIWIAIKNGPPSERLIIWDSIPNISELPVGRPTALSLVDIQSTACSPPCAASGICSASDNNKRECDACDAKCTSCKIPNFTAASTGAVLKHVHLGHLCHLRIILLAFPVILLAEPVPDLRHFALPAPQTSWLPMENAYQLAPLAPSPQAVHA